VSPGRENEAKSVSLRGGAGAEGEIVAFNGMEIGGREEAPRDLVGAVEPDRRPGRTFAVEDDPPEPCWV